MPQYVSFCSGVVVEVVLRIRISTVDGLEEPVNAVAFANATDEVAKRWLSTGISFAALTPSISQESAVDHVVHMVSPYSSSPRPVFPTAIKFVVDPRFVVN